MVYKYQKETINELKKVVGNLNEKTNEHYRVQIGTTLEDNGFEIEIVPIFLEINGKSNFTKQNEEERFYGNIYRECNLENLKKIYFIKNVFLKLNTLLDKIIKDNKKREEFHEKLNIELKALNNTLNR